MRRSAGIQVKEGVSMSKIMDVSEYRAFIERAKMVFGITTKEVGKSSTRVSFKSRMMDAIKQAELRAHEFVTLPVNVTLWLEALGCQKAAETNKIFYGLVYGVKTGLRLREVDGALSIREMPVHRRMEAYINTEYFKVTHDGRSYNTMQMLFTALCFAAMGRWHTYEADIVKASLADASENMHQILPLTWPDNFLHRTDREGVGDLPVRRELHSADAALYPLELHASYSANNQYMNTMLTMTLPGSLASQYLLNIAQAADIDRHRSKIMTKQEIFIRLLSYIRLSRSESLEESQKTAAVFSNDRLW